MKKLLIIVFTFFIFLIKSYAQIGYVPVEDEIYHFLDRMNTLGILDNYNSFELPKTRKNITTYLKIISNKTKRLNSVDKNKLTDYLIEFEFDLTSSLNKSDALFPNWNFKYLLSEKEKFLYSYSNSTGTSFFINFIGKLDHLFQSDYKTNQNRNATLFRFGGEFRGSLFSRVGFSVNTTNGSFSGNKSLAQSYSSLKYNYKFTRTSGSDLGDNYFDETSAFLSLDYDFVKLKIGNDRNLFGYGKHKVLLSDNAPRMEYINFLLTYKSFNFSFFHGKLLGNQHQEFDDEQGGINIVSDKYFIYHRIGLNISKHLNFGAGEMIIYANRNIDFSYLNPFNFYKSAEHANQDRDNAFLFFDFQNNTIDGLKLYSTILIDDIDFGKIGSGWYGNQTLMSFGAYSNQLYKIFPIDIELQYIKISPYVFTHRIKDNNFTNSDFNLGSTLQPNSSSTHLDLYYSPHYRVNINLGFNYTLHGANKTTENGELKTNYGGNILVGHRPGDSEEIYFLGGNREIFREYNFKTTFEPIKNWLLSININYINNILSRSQHSKQFFTRFSLYIKL